MERIRAYRVLSSPQIFPRSEIYSLQQREQQAMGGEQEGREEAAAATMLAGLTWNGFSRSVIGCAPRSRWSYSHRRNSSFSGSCDSDPDLRKALSDPAGLVFTVDP